MATHVGLALLVCSCLVAVALGSFEQPAYRFLQYSAGEAQYGPQSASMSLTVTTKSGAEDNDRLGRNVVVLRLDELDADTLPRLVTTCGGVVILISDAPSAQELVHWRQAEAWLLSHKAAVPVYFARFSEQWGEILADVNALAGSLTQTLDEFWPLQNSYHLEVAAPAPRLVDSVHLPSVHAFLRGAGDGAKTIAIVAHADTFASAPALAYGVRDNGSGLVALLELLKTFSSLYADPHTVGGYNLIFLATSGGRMNHVGAKHWLSKLDPEVADGIEFALSLDAIADERLHMHVTRKAKTERVERLYGTLESVAARMGVPLEFVYKKINLQDDTVYWGHEQFSRKRITAGTLSGAAEAAPTAARSDLFDTLPALRQETLARNVAFVREALVHYVYAIENADQPLLQDGAATGSALADAWLRYADSHARMDGFAADAEQSAVAVVRHAMEQLCSEVVFQDAVISAKDLGFGFYTPTEGTISVFQVKPVTLDIVYLLSTVVYLIGLNVALSGWSESVRKFQRLIKRAR